MKIPFSKYDGAGNDFVAIDNRTAALQLSADQIAHICHRRFGVGADGLLLLQNAPDGFDFSMRYYNSDGHPATMCGNGARCIAAFALDLGLGSTVADHPQVRFLADDGPHHAEIIFWNQSDGIGIVTVGMKDVPSAQIVRCPALCAASLQPRQLRRGRGGETYPSHEGVRSQWCQRKLYRRFGQRPSSRPHLRTWR